MRFDDRLLEDIKARIPPSRLIGRTVNLQRAGASFKALSPFTKEKTPSFYVNDEKRIFKCFSSGLGGDIFKWLQLTEGLSFPEAVERLAAEAGVALPERDPEAAAKDKRKRELTDWLEAAQAFFAETLRSPAGAEARAYLIRRGVPEADWTRFEIGYAPDAWEALSNRLRKQGASTKDLLAVGLVRESNRGEGGYDAFRHRVTFAIRDPSGRLVGFGGRALGKDEKAKYINSPESDVFKKGEVLYRFPEARKAAALSGREAARRGLVIVEGYMDAIALAQAGIEEAVATLGTAMTPEQIELAWRAGPRPTLFLDGDAAGVQAGYRVVDRVLPKLEPGRSMRFARLTGAKDPDELVRAEGLDGARRVLDGAESLAALMWERAVATHPVASPDDAAELEAALKADVDKIVHQGVRGHYRAELMARFNAAYGYRARMRRDRGSWGAASEQALPVTRARKQAENSRRLSEARRLLHALLDRPEILEGAAEQLAHLEFPDPALAELRDGLVAAAEGEEAIDKLSLSRHLAELGVDMTAAWVRDELGLAEAPVIIQADAAAAEALAAWRREADVYHRRLHGREEQQDLNDAALAGVDAGDIESARRFAAAAQALASPEARGDEDAAPDDAAQGARARFDAAIQALDAARDGKAAKRRP